MFRIGAVLAAFLIAGSVLAHGFGGSSIPLPDDVVIFGEKSVQIAQNTNILGGDIASNKRALIGRDVFIEGSVLADRLVLQQGATIIGNAEANRIKNNGATILGETTTPRETPNYELPTIPDSTPGTQRIRIRKDETATLQPGAYGAVSIGRGANVTLEPGTYDIRRLHIGRNATLTIPSASLRTSADTTMLNIKNNLFIGAGTIVDLASGRDVDDLALNIRGHGTVFVGKSVFGAGNITAPNAKIYISKETTWRGRLVGKRVRVGKEAIISSGISFGLPNTPDEIVTDIDGSTFPVNEVVVNLADGVPETFAQEIADMINGRIAGFSGLINLYVIEVETADIASLNAAVDAVEALSDPRIEGVFRNYILGIE